MLLDNSLRKSLMCSKNFQEFQILKFVLAVTIQLFGKSVHFLHKKSFSQEKFPDIVPVQDFTSEFNVFIGERVILTPYEIKKFSIFNSLKKIFPK